jgi:hypothetical protein
LARARLGALYKKRVLCKKSGLKSLQNGHGGRSAGLLGFLAGFFVL